MAEHHEPFDAEPTSELSEGEPRTPMWLPVLGAVLFLLAGILFWGGGTSETTATPSPTRSATVSAPSPVASVPGAAAGRPLRVLRPPEGGPAVKPGTPVRRAPGKALPRGTQ